MKKFNQTIAAFALATAALSFLPLSAQTNQQEEQIYTNVTKSLESMANDMGISISVKHSIQSHTLSLTATMTDSDDSVEYIVGPISEEGTLQMISSAIAPLLVSNPQITSIKGTITDSENQEINLTFSRDEILKLAGIIQ